MDRRTLLLLLVVIIIGTVTSFLAWKYTTPAQFTLEVISRPRSPTGTEGKILSVTGQTCVFLVVVEDEESWLQGNVGLGGAVNISASGSSRIADVKVLPELVIPGQVSEVTVIPDKTGINETFTMTFTAERYGVVKNEDINIEVVTGEDELIQRAKEMREIFIPWLAEHYPELGITNDTDWTETIVNPRILVVMHYIFYSDEWEMYLTWHVTIPPYDWTRIYLRRRFSETHPSYAFEVSSVTAEEEPYAVEVPDWV